MHLDSKPSLITRIVHHPCCGAIQHTRPRLLNFYLWQRDDQSECFRASYCLFDTLPPDICLAPGHEDERVVTASSDHTVRVWNMSTRTCDRVLSDAHSIKLVRCLIGYLTH
jgi:WD40 repeat protein